jgi:hypothetical protein
MILNFIINMLGIALPEGSEAMVKYALVYYYYL